MLSRIDLNHNHIKDGPIFIFCKTNSEFITRFFGAFWRLKQIKLSLYLQETVFVFI